ncbi:hypothetical protein G7046_g3102 [Stylonectria norvegica]|nr:hypothetical protein G7046_g3102 [Stylonectria norvegica]
MSSVKTINLKPRACPVCHQKKDLSRCSSCQVIYYCGRDHQASHRATHKCCCLKVKKARALLQSEEQKLRDLPPDPYSFYNVFEDHVGQFWGITETRPYMRARYGVAEATLKHLGPAGGYVDAVQVSLDHLKDMLRLCRGDNMGVRQLIPALYIRLGRDQEAYDFVKWYSTVKSDYDWGDMDLPFLDLKGEDALESPTGMWVKDRWLDLAFSVAVTLIKVRVLLDLQALQNATRALRGTVPQEIIEIIRGQLVGGVVESRLEILLADTAETSRIVTTIKGQIKDLYKSIDKYNTHFWPSILYNPGPAVAASPEIYSAGTKSESNLVVGYSYASWAETPGALEMAKAIDGMF